MKLTFGKQIYSVRESYCFYYHGLRTAGHMLRAGQRGELTPQLRERLMLAVTEVNGCALCAWGHARMALESGMSGQEIGMMLRGELDSVPPDEIPAVLFAQHYAATRGRPSRASWERMVALYGASKAGGILGAIRMIMIGNAYGIAGGAFLSRWRGRPDPRSGLLYELAMIAGAAAFLPVAILHAAVAGLLQKPLITFPPIAPAAGPV